MIVPAARGGDKTPGDRAAPAGPVLALDGRGDAIDSGELLLYIHTV